MRIFILLLILPALGFAQSKRTVFIESGVSVFKPFTSQEQISGPIYSDVSLPVSLYDYKFTYKTSAGYYVKAGMEMNYNTSNALRSLFP